MKESIYLISKADLDVIGSIRCIGGLQAASDDKYIWIRGIDESGVLANNLRRLPVQHRYLLGSGNLLFVPGSLTPTGNLKEMKWQSLENFIPVEVPVASFPGRANQQIPVALVPSGRTRPGAALLTSLDHWKNFAETASAIRLRALRFVVSENNEVLILGHPLPPLPGKEYSNINNNLLPAGYDFEISMVSGFIQEKLNPDQKAILLFDIRGQYQLIASHCIVQANRSAIRLTKYHSDKIV